MVKTPWMDFEYSLDDSIFHLPLNIKNKKFVVLLNSNLGSWAVLNEEEYNKYKKGKLEKEKMEYLFLRGLAKRNDGKKAEISFKQIADIPSLYILNVTLRCNLRCSYCFAECTEKGEDMSKKVIKAIRREIVKSNLEKFVVEFQGGEPFLVPEIIEYTCDCLSNIPKKVTFRVETNGTIIDDEIIRLIKEFNISVGVSLDGPQKVHDLQRHYPDGKGTFNEIIRNIKLMKKRGIEIKGSVVTITKNNVNLARDIYFLFKELGFKAFKPRPVNPAGRAKLAKLNPSNEEWFRAFKTFYELYKKYKTPIVAEVDIYSENVYTPIRDYICLRWPCGAGREVISINPNGDVYPCDGFKGVTEFKLGNILEEGILDCLNNEAAKELRERHWSKVNECKNCIFKSMCGPCPYATYGAFGSINHKSVYCEARRKIFWFLVKEWIKENCL